MVEREQFSVESKAMLSQLYGTAYYILRARADAEDAVQQGLMKAWAAREKCRAETFRPWLVRIVINECHNIQRHRMRIVPMEQMADYAETFEPPDPNIAEALHALPDVLRLPVVLKYLAGFKEREVAYAMRLPVSTIKSRLTKARKLLRGSLAEGEVSFDEANAY